MEINPKIATAEMLLGVMDGVGLSINDREEVGTLAYVVSWMNHLDEDVRTAQIDQILDVTNRGGASEFVHSMCLLAHAAAVTDVNMSKDDKTLVNICADAFDDKYKKGTLRHFGFIPKQYYPEWFEKFFATHCAK